MLKSILQTVIRVLTSLFFLPFLAFAQDAEWPKIQASDMSALLAKEGENVVVSGFVVETGTSASGINFLNFRDSEFVCVTFGRNLSAFPEGTPAELYKGKDIEIRGTLELYRGAPQIRLESPSQVVLAESPKPMVSEEVPETAPKVAEVVEPKAPEPGPKPEAVPSSGQSGVELVDGLPPVDWRKYFSN